MRDINGDLLKHPFDEEVARACIWLCKYCCDPIVATIDRFGLKTRYLRKHKERQGSFFAAC